MHVRLMCISFLYDYLLTYQHNRNMLFSHL